MSADNRIRELQNRLKSLTEQARSIVADYGEIQKQLTQEECRTQGHKPHNDSPDNNNINCIRPLCEANNSILISQKLADDIGQEIGRLLHNWSPSDQHADYRCEFCGERANTNLGDITHSPDCAGIRIHKTLWDLLKNDYFS